MFGCLNEVKKTKLKNKYARKEESSKSKSFKESTSV